MRLRPEEIHVEAERILASRSFARSERLRRFLRFVVDSALEEKQEQLKEYVLGVEVYQKTADFDPRLDSTVRVEASRLRAKLREYYEAEGRDDPVRIELPKGAYVPLFRRAEPSALRRAPARVIWIAGFLISVVLGVTVLPRLKRASAVLTKPLTAWAGREMQPSFSPDGKQIAMTWSGVNDDNLDIWVKSIGAGSPRRLTTDPAPDGSPSWSPDGRSIAFVRDSREGSGLYVLPVEGGEERLVTTLGRTSGATYNRVLDWLPQAQAVVVTDRNSPTEPFSIFRIDVAHGAKHRLTLPPKFSVGDSQPAVSPDGSMIAFVRELSQHGDDIYIVPAVGGEPRRITFDNQVITGLAWSEAGSSIVFSSERGAAAGGGGLWRIGVASNSRAQMEQVPGVGLRARLPAIARAGHLLAYQESFQNISLWRVPVNGGTPESVVASTREDVRPDYAHDGRHIVFNSNRSGNWEVWVANADGSDCRQVTSYAGAPAANPRWSPNGRLIAFDYRDGGNADIFVITPEGGPVSRLTTDASAELTPSWSRDGKWLYFSSNRSGTFEIWRLSVEHPAQVVQVTRGGGTWPLESPDGESLYFKRIGPEAAGEIWRVPVEGGKEARVFGSPALTDSWVVSPQGIYFIEQFKRIAYYRFVDGQINSIASLGGLSVGLAISPDSRWLLYGKRDRAGSDIMLVEDFR